MSDISKRISALSPEKRKLFESLLKEKGLKPAGTVSKPVSSIPQALSLTRFPGTPLVGIKTKGSKPAIFFVHPAEGNVFSYLDLIRYLDSGHLFYGLQSDGMDGEQKPLTKIEDMAANYIKAIKKIQGEGPYSLCGYSMGGIVVYEMAQQLLQEGERLSPLFLIDVPTTAYTGRYLKRDAAAFLKEFIPDFQSSESEEVDISSDEYSDYLSDRQLASFLELAKKNGLVYSDFAVSQVERYFKSFKVNNLALLSYSQKTYTGKIVYFKAEEQVTDNDLTSGWNDLVSGNIEIYDVPGNHFTMLKEPHVRVLAERFRGYIDK